MCYVFCATSHTGLLNTAMEELEQGWGKQEDGGGRDSKSDIGLHETMHLSVHPSGSLTGAWLPDIRFLLSRSSQTNEYFISGRQQ